MNGVRRLDTKPRTVPLTGRGVYVSRYAHIQSWTCLREQMEISAYWAPNWQSPHQQQQQQQAYAWRSPSLIPSSQA